MTSTEIDGARVQTLASGAGIDPGDRVMVTGGSGFVGTHVISALTAAGARVLSVDIRTPRQDLPAGALFEWCDIRGDDLGPTMRQFAPRTVVHLAAQVGGPASALFPHSDADINIGGTIRVVEAAAAAGAARLVFAGCCQAYGPWDEDLQPSGIDEGTPDNPRTPYGLSKATAARYLHSVGLTHERLSTITLILGSIYGRGARRDDAISRLVADATAGRRSVLRGGGAETRDFVHVDDVVEAILRAGAADCRWSGRVNIGAGVETSIAEIWQLANWNIPNPPEPLRPLRAPGEIERMQLRIERASRVLGWAPRIAVADGIAALMTRREVT